MFKKLISKFNFWYTKRFILLDREYSIVLDLARKNHITVKFLRKFPGVIAEYSDVIVEESEIKYEFSILSNPNLDVDSRSFKRFSQLVFLSIVISALENSISQKFTGEIYENRDLDPFELDEERAVHEKGSSIPEKRVSKRKSRKKGV